MRFTKKAKPPERTVLLFYPSRKVWYVIAVGVCHFQFDYIHRFGGFYYAVIILLP